MTPFSDGLAEPDARIAFHFPNDRLINTMILETISITMYSSTNLLILRGNNGTAQFAAATHQSGNMAVHSGHSRNLSLWRGRRWKYVNTHANTDTRA